MKKTALKVIVVCLAILFSGCAEKEVVIKKPSLPKLKKCVVKKRGVTYTKKGDKICLIESEYKKLKRQNYRLRVCNELLNKQNDDFNKRYAK